MLEHLHFCYGGFIGGYTDIDIKVKNGTVLANVTPAVNSDKIEPIHLSKKASQKWLAALDDLEITKWRTHYAAIGIMVFDGIQWKLAVKYEGKRCRRIQGNNAFPIDWYRFLDLMEHFCSFSKEGQIDKAEFDVETHHKSPGFNSCFSFTQKDRLTVDRRKRMLEYKRTDENTTVTNSVAGNEADDILQNLEYLMPKIKTCVLPADKTVPVLNLTVTYHTGETVKVCTSYTRSGLPDEWDELASNISSCFSRYGYNGLLLSKSTYMSERKKEEYIYLSVSFQNCDDKKLYFYLTDDDTVSVDDQVVVSVGNEEELRLCNVEKVEFYAADEVPMPVDEVKHIIGKVSPMYPTVYYTCNKYL